MLIALENLKSIIIICLTVVIFTLFYLIFSGKFCHCSDVTCPNNDVLRSVLT